MMVYLNCAQFFVLTIIYFTVWFSGSCSKRSEEFVRWMDIFTIRWIVFAMKRRATNWTVVTELQFNCFLLVFKVSIGPWLYATWAVNWSIRFPIELVIRCFRFWSGNWVVGRPVSIPNRCRVQPSYFHVCVIAYWIVLDFRVD